MHLIFTKVTLPYRRAVNQYFSDFFYVKTLVEFFCFKLITQIFFRFVLSCCHSFIFHIYFLQSQNFLQMRILQSRLKGQKKYNIVLHCAKGKTFFFSLLQFVVCRGSLQSKGQRLLCLFVCQDVVHHQRATVKKMKSDKTKKLVKMLCHRFGVLWWFFERMGGLKNHYRWLTSVCSSFGYFFFLFSVLMLKILADRLID